MPLLNLDNLRADHKLRNTIMGERGFTLVLRQALLGGGRGLKFPQIGKKLGALKIIYEFPVPATFCVEDFRMKQNTLGFGGLIIF